MEARNRLFGVMRVVGPKIFFLDERLGDLRKLRALVRQVAGSR